MGERGSDDPQMGDVQDPGPVHGILVLGGAQTGKTSLVMSFLALASGSYPSRKNTNIEWKEQAMPEIGKTYELPKGDLRLGCSTMPHPHVVVTDTRSWNFEEEAATKNEPVSSDKVYERERLFPLSPWVGTALKGQAFSHSSILFVIDASAEFLWTNWSQCKAVARLLASLRQQQCTVVVAVTKLLKAREAALRDAAYGIGHGGHAGQDPCSSYEVFVGRYVEKLCVVLQRAASEIGWPFDGFSHLPEGPPFPVPNATMFDVPAWTDPINFQKWQQRKGTPELPNMKYIKVQLEKILLALSPRILTSP